MPRLLLPQKWFRQRRRNFYTVPSTAITVKGEILRRSEYYTRSILSADYSYVFEPTPRSKHMFTPLSITYGKTSNESDEYLRKLNTLTANAWAASIDEKTVMMKYTFNYSTDKESRFPIYWEVTASEAGNLSNLIFGKGTFSQFIKLETSFRKTWTMGEKSQAVAHFYGGIMKNIGGYDSAPFFERFYIGEANDMRGFTQRSLGPGNLHYDDSDIGYRKHNGDMKLVINAEYRPWIFGSLYGAAFVDIGNVWVLNHELRERENTADGINVSKADVGIDVGLGLRYDLDYFVIRLDWGFAIHKPYTTSKSGFFNVESFKDSSCLNFAIGYPF